jgi:hypothetical protein
MRSALLLLGIWGLLLQGIIASADAGESVAEKSDTQTYLSSDPRAERQANLEAKWGFEVRLSRFLHYSCSTCGFPSKLHNEAGWIQDFLRKKGKGRREVLMMEHGIAVGILRRLDVRSFTACEMLDGSGCGV